MPEPDLPPALTLDDAPVVTAPDGSTVRVLVATEGASTARFELRAGQTSRAVRHRTVDEIWHVLAGHGEMWRRRGEHASIDALDPGLTLAIGVGTSFQFRSLGPGSLVILGVTMPPWPGADEAEHVEGCPDW